MTAIVSTMVFHTYLLGCSDGSYYVGHTDDLEKRIGQHNQGQVGGYTAARRPVTLLLAENFATREEALAAERQIKGWSRTKKQALIAGDWGQIRLLARNRQNQ